MRVTAKNAKELVVKYLRGPAIFAAIDSDIEKLIRFTLAFWISAFIFGMSSKKED